MPYNGVSPPTAGELMCMFSTITSGAETMSLVQFESFHADPDATSTACLGATLAPTPAPPTAAEIFAQWDADTSNTLDEGEWLDGESRRRRRRRRRLNPRQFVSRSRSVL